MINMWLALTAVILAAAIGFNVLAVAVQHFEQQPDQSTRSR